MAPGRVGRAVFIMSVCGAGVVGCLRRGRGGVRGREDTEFRFDVGGNVDAHSRVDEEVVTFFGVEHVVEVVLQCHACDGVIELDGEGCEHLVACGLEGGAYLVLEGDALLHELLQLLVPFHHDVLGEVFLFLEELGVLAVELVLRALYLCVVFAFETGELCGRFSVLGVCLEDFGVVQIAESGLCLRPYSQGEQAQRYPYQASYHNRIAV